MLTRIRKATEDKDSGFTLIELLVVMIIIGILAAIAIPVFLNQRKRAVDTGVKSDLRTVANEVESYFTDLQLYPDATGAVTFTDGTATTGPVINTTPTATTIKATSGNVLVYTLNAAQNAYCIIGYNAKGTKSTATNSLVYVSSAGGMQPALSACPASY